MRVSVLLPVYNAGILLERAIRSILAQSLTDFEFIIIDDASKDESRATIERFAAEDSRIRAILHKDNIGLAETLNEGLRIASAPYIARMDQDDESLPERLGIQFTFMNSRPNIAVAGSFVYHMGVSKQHDRFVRLPSDSAAIKKRLPEENCIYHPSVIMNRALILGTGGYKRQFRNAEDYDLWLRLSREHELANIPIPLIRYHFSVEGMTLGRKWEQLYYVFLARASFHHTGNAWTEIERIAKAAHDNTDKQNFMSSVLDGTITELLSLGYTEQASKLVSQFSADVGRERTEKANARISEFQSTCHLPAQDEWLGEFLTLVKRKDTGTWTATRVDSP